MRLAPLSLTKILFQVLNLATTWGWGEATLLPSLQMRKARVLIFRSKWNICQIIWHISTQNAPNYLSRLNSLFKDKCPSIHICMDPQCHPVVLHVGHMCAGLWLSLRVWILADYPCLGTGSFGTWYGAVHAFKMNWVGGQMSRFGCQGHIYGILSGSGSCL